MSAPTMVVPSAVDRVVAGRTLKIEPVRVRDLAAFVAAVTPLASDLAAGRMERLLTQHLDRLLEATALGTGVDRAWLDEIGADELFELALAVVEVNADFFTRRMLPAIARVVASVAPMASMASVPPSTDGSSPSAPPASTTAP